MTRAQIFRSSTVSAKNFQVAQNTHTQMVETEEPQQCVSRCGPTLTTGNANWRCEECPFHKPLETDVLPDAAGGTRRSQAWPQQLLCEGAKTRGLSPSLQEPVQVTSRKGSGSRWSAGPQPAFEHVSGHLPRAHSKRRPLRGRRPMCEEDKQAETREDRGERSYTLECCQH